MWDVDVDGVLGDVQSYSFSMVCTYSCYYIIVVYNICFGCAANLATLYFPWFHTFMFEARKRRLMWTPQTSPSSLSYLNDVSYAGFGWFW